MMNQISYELTIQSLKKSLAEAVNKIDSTEGQEKAFFLGRKTALEFSLSLIDDKDGDAEGEE